MVRLTPVYFVAVLILLFLSWFAVTPVAAAQPKAVAVLYPELQAPYRGVVVSIIEGIQEVITSPVILYSLKDDDNTAQLRASINREQVAAIIALGGVGLAAAQHWKGEIPIVVGAMTLAPDDKERGVTGISLAADPEVFFDYLERIAPSVRRLHAVYDPESSGWLMQLARASASKRHFQFITYKSSDIKTSALAYRDILNKSRPGEDAIWLLPDAVTLDERVILPMLLQGAWDQKVQLFSGNPAHVKRGALFALFPDNKAMGSSLARMAEPYVSGDKESIKDDIVLLRDFQAAINVRTAEHGGLFISDELRQKFSLVFPTP